VMLMPSWTGQIGPVRGFVEGALVLGEARGGTLGIPLVAGRPMFPPGRKYHIFAGGVVAYAEADLGIVRPFLGLIWGSADGDPTDHSLHGFAPSANRSSAQFTGTPTFAHFDTSGRIGGRDYTCPARAQGIANRSTTGILAADPLSIGAGALGATTGTDCWHTVGQPFNDRPGGLSHLGLASAYSNVGTLLIPVGLKVFPLKGHELTGWYAYRGMVNPHLVEIAFAPELAAQGKSHIGKSIYHEVGAYWFWTLNANFDIRLSGSLGFAASASKELAHLSDCNLALPGVQSCHGGQPGMKAEARFRARF
jgi:hypothetical protein